MDCPKCRTALLNGETCECGAPPPRDEFRKCPSCAEQIRAEARKCRFCGTRLDRDPDYALKLIGAGLLLLTSLVVFFGNARIYYGGGIGPRLVMKEGFSLTDTFVNLNDILGQPRIAVASQHPAVKLQLEHMGVLESDDAMRRRIEGEVKEKIDRETQEFRRKYEY